jgi:tetratricopeptide (TPR) repeat protein
MRPPYKILLVLILISSPSLLVTTLGSNGFGFSNQVDTTEVNKYTRIALDLLTTSNNLKSAKAYIDSAEMICREKNIEMPALLHLARANYFLMINDLNNSVQEGTIAMKLAKNNKDTEVLIKSLNFLGIYNLRIRFLNESIDYFNKAIELSRKNKLKGYIPRNYLGLADVYRVLRDTATYRKTLETMIEEAQNEKDTSYLARAMYFLGSSLILNVRDFNKADSILKKCVEISKIRKDTGIIASALANIGYNFYLEKEYKLAIEYYNKSLNYSISGKSSSIAVNSLGNLGTIYRDLGDIKKSLKFYQKSIKQAKEINDIYDLYWVYLDMSNLYLMQKDTGNAYKTYVLYKKYNDEYTESDNARGLTEEKIRFDAKAHTKELELLSLKLSKQKMLIYGYTGLFILCLAIGFLILSRARINSRQRISEMNRKISEVTQANLRQQMNPHFIFNTLNSIQYYMYQHDKLATNNYLTKFSSLMRKVLENSQHTSVPVRDELDALSLYLELEKIRFKDKFEYIINVDEEIDTLLYKVPTMLIQPYVENSISHGLMPSEEKGLIKIDIKLEKDYISCIIEDNGIGREAAKEKKVKHEKKHNSLGTRITNSRLDLVNTLYGTSLRTIYTDLKNEQNEAIGTRVEIHIPIMS